MNIDNARLVFKAMAESKMRLNMSDWFQGNLSEQTVAVHECGTAACFAGHTVSALLPEARTNPWTRAALVTSSGSTTISAAAQELLGLTSDEKYTLFDSQVCVTHPDQSCGYQGVPACEVTNMPTIDQLKDVVAAVTKVDRIELD